MIGTRTRVLQALFEKHVLSGSDDALSCAFVYVPYHARRAGTPVMLIPEQQGPIWFSRRLVRDEYKRQHAGKDTRFGSPSRREGDSPAQRQGDLTHPRQGDGSSASTSSSASSAPLPPAVTQPKTDNGAPAAMNGRRVEGQGTPKGSDPWPRRIPDVTDQVALIDCARAYGFDPRKASFASWGEVRDEIFRRRREGTVT